MTRAPDKLPFAPNGRDLSKLKVTLQKRRDELSRRMLADLRDVRLESTKARHLSVEEDSAHASDRDDLILAIVEMKSETVKRIDHVLRLIEQGRYGTCAECGGEIADNRLIAMPFALRCTSCEDAHEERNRFSTRNRCPSGGTS